MKLYVQLKVEIKPVLDKQYYPKRTLPLDIGLLEKESQLQDLWIPLEALPKFNGSRRVSLTSITEYSCI